MSDRRPDSTLDATSPARSDGEAAGPASPRDAPTEPEVLLEVGERAGDFVIEGVLGRGSFGTVYRAAHHVIGRRAAVKVLRDQAAEASAIERFIDEARLVARLRHPNIVDVLGFGRLDDGRHFQVMDLIDGPTLTDFMREHGAVPLAEALPILRGIASALDAVHRAGVAHSDLKPANVVLERREGALVPKLIDFGVARLIAADAESTPSARSAAAGTPRYMAPEQCRGRTVDARADTYAFGVLAYEMLTGQPPFSGDDALELMLKHTSETPVAPSRLCASLPTALDPIVLGLLEKRPEQRPHDLAPVVEELAALASSDGPASARERPARSAWGTARIAGPGLVVAAVVAIVVLGQRGAPATPADPAATAAPEEISSASPRPITREPEAAAAATAAVTATHPDALGPDGGVGAEASAKAPRGGRPKRPAVAPSSRPTAEPGLDDPENPFGR